MAAKVRCKKGYNISEGYVEFKKVGQSEYCPVSNADCCEECKAETKVKKQFHKSSV